MLSVNSWIRVVTYFQYEAFKQDILPVAGLLVVVATIVMETLLYLWGGGGVTLSNQTDFITFNQSKDGARKRLILGTVLGQMIF